MLGTFTACIHLLIAIGNDRSIDAFLLANKDTWIMLVSLFFRRVYCVFFLTFCFTPFLLSRARSSLFFVFCRSSGLREASRTHLAVISVCPVRANSLYKVLQGVRRLVDHVSLFFNVLYILYTSLYRFAHFCYRITSSVLCFFYGGPRK